MRPNSPPLPAKAPPLWQQLQATAAVLLAVTTQGRSATAALEAVAPTLRPGVQAQVFHVLRGLGRARALRAHLARRKPAPEPDALLCCALALLGGEPAPYEGFTLVDQAVEAAKRERKSSAQASFLNACLRRYLRERHALDAAIDHDPVARWNHPPWWIEQLRREYPDDWQHILAANNTHPPLTLRVNETKTEFRQYGQALHAINIEANPVVDTGWSLATAVPVQRLPGFAEGWFSVQDAAAQRAAPLLLAQWPGAGAPTAPPLRLLDACAAPGGKTAHLLEYAATRLQRSVQVTALEIDPIRARRITENLQRLGLTAEVRVADAADVPSWFSGQPFDAILLDAPCTASGIVRRHPDVRWLRQPGDIVRLAEIQATLLRRLWPLVAPGGRLLYCTCSVFRAEGVIQQQTFLAHNTDAELMPSPGHLLPGRAFADGSVLDNSRTDEDGFFYALFRKRGA